MKRVFLILLTILFVLPISYATISIDNMDKLKYNIGDEIKISGYVLESTSVIGGLFSLAINCGDGNFKLSSVSLNLNNGEKKTFPTQFNTPKVIIPNALSGNCYIEATLKANNVVIDSGKSNTFEIARDLVGNFKIDKPKVQLGVPFTLDGNVFKLNNKEVEGSAELYLKSNTTSSFLLDVVNIKDGRFSFTYSPLLMPAGNYAIDILATDLYGNKNLFSNAANINIVDNLEVSVTIDKINLLPDEYLTVKGYIYDSFNNKVNDATVTIEVGNEVKVVKVENGEFEESFRLPININSGKQTVSVKAEDKLGNKGDKKLEFNVATVSTTLELAMNKEKVKPGEVVEITPKIYDQANNLIEDEVLIEILDPQGNSLVKNSIKTNWVLSYKLLDIAIPGTYIVKANVDKLNAKGSFEVEYITDIDIKLYNQTILLKNKGNVEYKKPLEINFDNGKYAVSKRLSIGPGELFSLNLGSYVPTGSYAIEVTSGDGRAVFENIPVSGKEIASFNIPYQTISVIVLGLLIYLFITKFNFSKQHSREHESELRLGRIHREKLLKNKDVEKKPFRFSAGQYDKKEAMQEYKERIIKDIQSTQDSARLRSKLVGTSYPKTESSYTRNRNEENKKEETPKSGMFNMFD